MSLSLICQAINSNPPHLIQFYYTGDAGPGYRMVEPHMVAYNEAEHLSLSGWLTTGATASGSPGWKEYLLASISKVTVLGETFSGPRPGYNPTGRKKVHNVQCAI